jgi:hypothetical protein
MVLVGPASLIPPGATFDLAVWLSSPVITRGAQFGLTFDPSKIQVTGIDEGDYYRSWAAANGASTILMPGFQVDGQHGWVQAVAVAIMAGTATPQPPVSGPTGSAILATVHCRALPTVSGNTSVRLEAVVVAKPTEKEISISVPSVNVTDAVLSIGKAEGAVAWPATPTPRSVGPNEPPPWGTAFPARTPISDL